MMNASTVNYRNLSAVTGLLIFLLATISGCGGGDDDGDAVDIPGIVPDILNYEIRQGTGVSLVLSQNPEVTVTNALLTGSFNRTTEAFTLVDVQPAVMTVDATDFLASLGTEFNIYTLVIKTTMEWKGDDVPTAGAFDVRSGPVSRIRVSVNPNVTPGVPGVDITYSPDGDATEPPPTPTSYSWEDFDGLFDNAGATEYEQIANFAYSLLRIMYEQGELVILALEFLGENDDALETGGTIVEDCDTMPYPPDDPAVLETGTSMVGWTDADNSTDISPGDTIYLDFMQCWDDDETDNIDTLYNGGIKFVNYTEVENAGVITRIGFEPTDGPGGIEYYNPSLIINETDDNGSNILIGLDPITLTGGFSMIFTSP
jgi:hypothetical protein